MARTSPGTATSITVGSISLQDGDDSTLKVDVLDLASNNALVVGVVDGSGNQITSFGGGTQYTEGDIDTTITGTAMLMEGASSTLLPIQGTVADGLLVNLGTNNDVTVTSGAITETNSGSILTSVQLIDDAIFTDDTSTHATGTTKGIGIMAAATPTDAAITANDIGMVAMTTDRKLHVAVMDALPAGTAAIGKLAANSGVDIGDVTLTANSGVDIGDVDVTSIAAGDNNIGNVDIASIAAGDNNIGNVDIVSGTITTVSALGVSTTGPQKAEDVAHVSGDMGIFALGVRQDTPNATAAASNDYHYLATDMVGGLRTALYETDFAVLGTNHVKKYYTSAGAATDGIIWSSAAGKRWYVTDIFINVSAAATVTLEDDLVAGDSPVWKAELAANSGWSHHFGTPLFSGEDAADLLITTSAGNVYVTVTGYEI